MPASQGVDSLFRKYTSLLRITGAEAGEAVKNWDRHLAVHVFLNVVGGASSEPDPFFHSLGVCHVSHRPT
jgi:hypothetical protein